MRGPHDQYVGDAGSQMRRGHLPGAVNHYWQDDLETAGFGTVFRPADSLRSRYLAEGIVPDRDIVLYCNIATEASHVYFVLKYLLGYPRVRIYAGSWTEWAEREELPIERGSGPGTSRRCGPNRQRLRRPAWPRSLVTYHLICPGLSHRVTTLR